ncbi:hypothetical protein IDH32_04045 [Pelagibacterales bacterium SAG-MED01]|nr:hypothetical protein [Pelagibacterales bacterium SAG-MED01]
MINRKIILGLFITCFLGACSSPTAMLGPAYTFSSTGNIYQTGFTYSSNEMITKYTGKTPIENIKKITEKKEKNIMKAALESKDFYDFVESNIKKTRKIVNFQE